MYFLISSSVERRIGTLKKCVYRRKMYFDQLLEQFYSYNGSQQYGTEKNNRRFTDEFENFNEMKQVFFVLNYIQETSYEPRLLSFSPLCISTHQTTDKTRKTNQAFIHKWKISKRSSRDKSIKNVLCQLIFNSIRFPINQ